MSKNRTVRRKKTNKRKFLIKIIFVFALFPLLLFSIAYITYNSTLLKFNNTKEYKTQNKRSISEELNLNNSTKSNNPKIKSSLILTSVGDCTLGSDTKFGNNGTLPTIIQQKNNDYSYFFKNVNQIFNNDDITTANLETTFTNTADRAEKAFVFKGSPEYAKSLILGGIDTVNISNNHIYDYKQRGFNDTINTLKSNNIAYFGEGNKVIKNINGVQIGFLGYMGFNDNKEFLTKVKADIDSLKSMKCIIVINFHWGVESQYYPIQPQKNIAHFAIDNGADLIIGHHPHVIQGIERYKNKIICYSLGNFCFGGNTNPTDKNTFIFQCKFNLQDNKLNSYDVKIIPCSISSKDNINDYCPTPLEGDRKNNVIDKINNLSPNLGFKITDNFTNIKVE